MLALLALLSCAEDEAALGGGASSAPAADPAAGFSAALHPRIGSLVTVRWEQREAADALAVEYSVDEGSWRSTPEIDGAIGDREQLLLGLPYGTDFRWRVAARSGDAVWRSAEQSFATGALPEGVPPIAVTIEGPDDGAFVLTSVTERDTLGSVDPGFWLAIIDRRGRYVWLLPAAESAWAFHPRPSRDGTALLWEESYDWTAASGTSYVYRVRLDGEVTQRWETPGLHHSFAEVDANRIVYNGRDGGRSDLVWIQDAGEERRVIWDCAAWYEAEGLPMGEDDTSCGANAIAYFPGRDSALLSMFTDGSLIELGLADGEVLWHAAPQLDHGLDSDTTWYWQHEPKLLSEDRILLSSGGYFEGNEGARRFDFTAAYELELDLEAGGLRQVWSFVSEDWIAAYKGGADRTASGSTLHFYGDTPGLREISPEGEVIWQLQVEGEGPWIGRCTLLEDLYALAP